ncbi:hypothetical protein Ctu_1p00570 (plasmid) [Cronobacter turicensis z3032]|uniref:Uncharacterized protein n=1 Tax=Cronobacter turicensis (strain DSM 18703 / CCUG 55852 / LMG 23827 / z3032) TaxID=693216 RepID=C9Y5E9_CROTZ|nr:hypothetical protein Ctu_1p00570 [Cronobacter turicensis z3032]
MAGKCYGPEVYVAARGRLLMVRVIYLMLNKHIAAVISG